MLGGQNWHSYVVPFSAVYKRYRISTLYTFEMKSAYTRREYYTLSTAAFWSVIEEKLP